MSSATTPIVIAGATRTAVGAFNGTLANTPAHDLGTAVMTEALSRAKTGAGDVGEVIFGQVLTAGVGQNPARQAAMNAGIAKEAPAVTINQVCGSGLRSIAMAYQSIRNGDAKVVIAGGQESMSLSTHCTHLRAGTKMGDTQLVDTMIKDGLWDAFNGYHMGVTAENVAKEFQITRDEQDAFAVASQNKAEAAKNAGRFKDEIVPFTIKTRKGEIVFEQDEYIRDGATIDSVGKLRPAFDREGSVTAGNASGLNDGAAAVVLMSEDDAAARGVEPLARIVSWAHAGVDPSVMGTGPIPASKLALEKAGWSIGDLDLVEANEAFAAQACAVNKGVGWDPEKVNVNGGAIAIGHPIGASGARIFVTLLHEMKRRDAKKGLATLCIGGGMGIAMCVERA